MSEPPGGSKASYLIRSSLWEYAIGFAGAGPLAWACLVAQPSWFSFAMFLLFTVSAAVCLFRLVRPKTLHLTRDGLSYTLLLGGKRFARWDDIDGFVVQHTRTGSKIGFYGVRITGSSDTFPSSWRRRSTGGYLGGGWRGSTQKLVALLEEWRIFYS